MSLVVNPYAYFTDTEGRPLNGYLYVGEVGKNAENYPINIYYDALFSTAAPNPLTVVAGYIYNAGIIAQIYAGEDYSLIVKKTNGSLVYSNLNLTGMTNGAIGTIDEMKDFTSPYNNYALNVLGNNDAGDGEGGLFYYDANSTAVADDINIVEPTSGIGRWIRLNPLYTQTYTIATVDDFDTVPENYTTVIVKDINRGGIFNRITSTTANGGTIFSGTGYSWERQYSGAVNVKWFGAKSTTESGYETFDSTMEIQAAIVALRANPASILDTIGGSTITAYSSGVVEFPSGVYKVSPDTLLIYQDLGLMLRGQGSRRTNNAVHAPTTILVSGASSGYGIKAYRNGGRGLTIEDMDICYETSAFTGSLLDILDCPGVTLNRVFIGTYGITSGTRLQTAASCVRLTYDEFFTANNCVFDGAVDGIWFDDARTELGNTFGGSVTALNNCHWYDFTGDMIRQDGLRTREGLRITGCAFNPISVDPVRCVDLNNVDGLTMATNGFQGSVANKPTTEWLRLVNCTGSSVMDSLFGDFAKAGTLSGMINISGNRVYCTEGFTITGGVVRGGNNEFSKGTSGLIFAPTIDLSFDIGPDLFKSGVTYSYDIPVDNVLLAGRISYDVTADASTSKFRNTTSRVQIGAIDGKQISVSDATYALSSINTGRTILAIGSSAQTFTLPTPVPGTKLLISKISNKNLTLNCAGGTNFYGAGSAYYTSAALTGAAMGGLELEAYATVGWIIKSEAGTWSYS